MEKGGTTQTSFTKSLEVEGESPCRWRWKQKNFISAPLPEYCFLGNKALRVQRKNLILLPFKR